MAWGEINLRFSWNINFHCDDSHSFSQGSDDHLPDILTDIKSNYAYRRGRLIGKGGFAKVYEVTDLTVTSSGGNGPNPIRVYADKVINKEVFAKRTSKDKVKREIQLHKDLIHPNVVQVLLLLQNIFSTWKIREEYSFWEQGGFARCFHDFKGRLYRKSA